MTLVSLNQLATAMLESRRLGGSTQGPISSSRDIDAGLPHGPVRRLQALRRGPRGLRLQLHKLLLLAKVLLRLPLVRAAVLGRLGPRGDVQAVRQQPQHLRQQQDR